ncbi:MAG: PEGA domain-containing protein [Vicinamibacterales bacterium]
MLHQIGAGVLGPVFRAYQPDPGRLVAVKQFRLDIPPDSAHRFVAALDRLIAADLTHSGIAAPLAAGLESFTPYLAQDFVAADSFDVVMRDHGAAPVAEVLRVATQLAGALDFAAAVQVYHGALHPRDVLVSADDTRLTGLGIAQALEGIGLTAPVRRPYAAPERVAGQAWDRRADVFSVAALVYEMLFGRRVAGIGDAAAESITAVDGVDADALRALFTRALAERPEARFETVLSFAEALHEVLSTATQPVRQSRTRRKRDTHAPQTRRSAPPSLPLDADLPLHDSAGPTPDPASVVLAAEPATTPAAMVEPSAVPLSRAVAPVADADVDLRAAPDQAPEVDAVADVDLTAADMRRFADVDVPAPESGPVRREKAAEVADDASEVALPLRPLDAVEVHEAPSFGSVALEQSRSAVWPIVLALVVGLSVGFALGYGTGTRERTRTQTASVAPAPAGVAEPPPGPVVPASPPAEPPVPQAPAAAPGDAGTPPGAQASESPVTAPATPSEVLAPAPRAVDRPAPSAAPSSPSATRGATAAGRLNVRSTPAGARVVVDGREAGVTPTTVRDLAVGTHLVRIAHQGYVTAERRVRIRTAQPAQSIEVDLEASRPVRQAATPAAPPERTSGMPADAARARAGSLMVDSRPAGARVLVDGKLVGTTPLLLDSVEAGEHTVRLELDGFRAWTAGTKITGGERTRVSGSLEQR